MNENLLLSLYGDYSYILALKLINDEDVEVFEIKEEYDCKPLKSYTYYDYYMFFRSIIHKSDLKLYDVTLYAENLFYKIKNKEKITAIFKLKNREGIYENFQFETIPYKGDEYDALLTWKRVNSDYNLLEGCMSFLVSSYYKIIKANLTNNDYTEIRISNNENITSKKLSTWLKNFASYGNIFHEDIPEFLRYTDINNLRTLFKSEDSPKQTFRYRRLSHDGTYRWVALDIVPSKDFQENNKVVIMYIRDIHDDYTHQVIENRKIQYYASHDPLSGLNNKLAYDSKMAELVINESVGVLFIKLTNIDIYKDRFTLSNHVRRLTSIFRSTDCYRISRDEIVILIEDICEVDFIKKTNELKNENIEYLIFGYEWRKKENVNMTAMLNIAEDMLYNE